MGAGVAAVAGTSAQSQRPRRHDSTDLAVEDGRRPVHMEPQEMHLLHDHAIDVDVDPTLVDPQNVAEDLMASAEDDVRVGNLDAIYDFDTVSAEWEATSR